MRNQANLGFEEKLFKAADKLRKNMDAAEYKHVVLGLIFLKYVSDAFQHRRGQLEVELRAPDSGFDDDAVLRTLEDRDEYAGEGVFWVPVASRWDTLQATATQPMIGQRIDDALYQLEQENPSLKAVFNRNYARPSLEDRTLTELINLFSDIDFMAGRHDENESEQDVVGRVYEYCLKSFASLEGKRGGQFYTPPVVVRILVEMLEPYEGRVFDPCCGSGGMFVQSKKFIREHSRQQPGMFNPKGISVYGQESNETTWRLCQMNLAVHGIDGDIKWNPEGSFLRDAHPDLRADFVIANPPFNDSDWSGHLLRDDPRWKLGIPPVGNANYAWIQHFLYHLNDDGFAGFVMANGSLSSQQSGEGDIRRRMVEEDVVECIIALPGQLFYSTGIPVCLWFLAKNKAGKGFRNRKGETLFINAAKLGYLEDRTHRMFEDEEIARITDTYHRWRGTAEGAYEDVPGFCKAASREEIAKSDFVLTPGRYCGSEAVEDDGEEFAAKFGRLKGQLEKLFEESAELQGRIQDNLTRITSSSDDGDRFLELSTGITNSNFDFWFHSNEGNHAGRPHVHAGIKRSQKGGGRPSGSFDAETGELIPGTGSGLREKDVRAIGEIIRAHNANGISQHKALPPHVQKSQLPDTLGSRYKSITDSNKGKMEGYEQFWGKRDATLNRV